MKKQPKQQRSKQLVEAILDASTRVLSTSKLSQMTTNKVADVAGVSIGSLYDYFPNKNSIVVALMDSRMQTQLNSFFEIIEKESSLEGAVEACITFINQEYLNKKDFLREVFLLAPENGRMEALFLNRMKAQKKLEQFLVEKLGYETKWAQRKSFLVMQSIIGVIETYIVLDEVSMSHEEFLKELRLMMSSILEVKV